MSILKALDGLDHDESVSETQMKRMFGNDFEHHTMEKYFQSIRGVVSSTRLFFEEEGAFYLLCFAKLPKNEGEEQQYLLEHAYGYPNVFFKVEGDLLEELLSYFQEIEHERNVLKKMFEHPSLRLKTLF